MLRFAGLLALAMMLAGSVSAEPKTTDYAMQMSNAMVTALRDELLDADRGWLVTAIHHDSHERLTKSGDNIVEVTEYHATIQLQSSVKGATMLMQLEGHEPGVFTSGSVTIHGSAFSFDDAQLLTWGTNAIATYGPLFEADIVGGLFGPVEPAEEE